MFSSLLRTWPARWAAPPHPFRGGPRGRRSPVEIVDQPLAFLDHPRGGTVKVFQLALQPLQFLKSVAHREAPAVAL